MDFMRNLLTTEKYDAWVDFLIYPTTAQFRERYEFYLQNVGHYIYLSSYRIYANEEHPVTENSPRLLDIPSDDPEYLSSEDYSLYKARGEDMLKASNFKNWTAIRPAITYSKRRFQLVTLEANVVVARAMQRKKVVLPEQARKVQATMSWAGDVAKMISRLVLNENAYREIYTVATSEHHTWGEIADYYKELIGLEAVWVDKEDYIDIIAGTGSRKGAEWQLCYDRLFDRIMDNRKILKATGMKQEELTTLKEGLRRELNALPKGYEWPETDINERMDAYLAARGQ